jgi:hypothetical protein
MLTAFAKHSGYDMVLSVKEISMWIRTTPLKIPA